VYASFKPIEIFSLIGKYSKKMPHKVRRRHDFRKCLRNVFKKLQNDNNCNI